MSLYLDTSLLVPYYSPEPLSAQCEALILSEIKSRLAEILDAADELSIEEPEILVDVLHRRVVELRREGLALEVKQARHEHAAGQCRPTARPPSYATAGSLRPARRRTRHCRAHDEGTI